MACRGAAAIALAGGALLCFACGGASPPPAPTPTPATETMEAGVDASASAAPIDLESEHKQFLTSCGNAAVSSADYCECAWGETRKVFSDEELSENRTDARKLEQARAKISSSCASKLPEDAVKQGFFSGCVADKPEMQPYCDCSWTEYRKKFSATELASADVVSDERFMSTRADVVKACSSKMPEQVARDGFVKGCSADEPRAEAFCSCAWKELRKTSSAAEIEAGTFDKKAAISKADKACGKLKPTMKPGTGTPPAGSPGPNGTPKQGK